MSFEEQKFRHEMESALEKMQRQKSKITDLVSEGKMSSARAKYAEAIIVLDFCLLEAKELARLGMFDNAAQSFAEGKRFLDNIARYTFESGNETLYKISRRRYDSALNSILGDSSSQEQDAFAA